MQRFQLSVNVNDTLTLDAGWWEETKEETALGKPLPCRLIHPPEPTMYDQVLRHLETISHEARIPPKSQLNFSPPDSWSLTERTAEVLLEGAEP